MFWCHECNRESMVLPCSHCNSEFCEEMEDGEFEGIPMEIPMGIEMQGNPIGDLLTNLMGQMARMPDNIPENGADIGITIIEDGGDSRARRFRRRQQQRARDEAVDNGDDQGDIRNFMAQQVMNQLAELLFQRAPGGRPPPNFGDYAVGQGGLDEIITRLMEMHAEENKPPAADEETLRNLPRLKFSDSEEHKECQVCQEDYKVGDDTIKLPCKHIYHPDCILNWLKLNGTCPVCRFSLVPDPDEMPPLEPIEPPSSSAPGPSSSTSSGADQETQKQSKRRNENVEHTDRRSTRSSTRLNNTASGSASASGSQSRVAPRAFEFSFGADGFLFGDGNGTFTFRNNIPPRNSQDTNNPNSNISPPQPQPDVD